MMIITVIRSIHSKIATERGIRKKPSQFLRHLTSLAAPLLDDNIWRTSWIQRLPTHTQQILKSHPTENWKHSHSSQQLRSLDSANSSPSTSLTDGITSQVLKPINDLTKMVADLKSGSSRCRKNSRFRKYPCTRILSRQKKTVADRVSTYVKHFHATLG